MCNHPVDTTFALEEINSTWVWEHTFASADETHLLEGLPINTELHVALETDGEDELYVQANFVIQGELVSPFLDTEVELKSCDNNRATNTYLPLVIAAILFILIAALIALFISYRKEKLKKAPHLLLNSDSAALNNAFQDEITPEQYNREIGHVTTNMMKKDIKDAINSSTETKAMKEIINSCKSSSKTPIYNPKHKKKYKHKSNGLDQIKEEEVILNVQNISGHTCLFENESWPVQNR